jgi:putative phage-type endonuclease
MNFTVIAMEQGTEEWLNWRKGGITATEAGRLLTPGSKARFISEKLQAVDTASSPSTQAMQLGHILEPYARAIAEEKLERKFEPECIQSIEHPWRRVSLDGLHISDTGEVFALECKCGFRYVSDYKNSKSISQSVYNQMQYQLLVLGINEMHLILYHDNVGTNDFSNELAVKNIHVAEWGGGPFLVKIAAHEPTQKALADAADKTWCDVVEKGFSE